LSLVYLASFIFPAVLTWASLPFWRRCCVRWNLVDEPGPRKIHACPIPLAGGLSILTGLTLALLAAAALGYFGGGLDPDLRERLVYGLGRRWPRLAAMVGGALGMLLLGIADDRHELRPRVKFLGQCVIAAVVALSGVRVTLFVPSAAVTLVLTVLWIVAVTNAVNFQDNMNGLCAGLAWVAAGWFGFIAARQGHYLVASMAFLVAGAAAGFLPWNFPRSRAFLGDSGSHLVGFLLATLAILPHYYSPQHQHRAAVLAPLFILVVPLADMAAVVVYRWRSGQPFYLGDTNHFSHRLERAGLSRTAAVVVLWGASVVGGAVAFMLL
jgi:UDP-GlcNAc:undecaprenyl-phosphate/decaprenyl-phosphate GlcNAc-1-phosphate transferase